MANERWNFPAERLHDGFHDTVTLGVNRQMSVRMLWCSLQVDDDNFATATLGAKWQIADGLDLQAGAQAKNEVGSISVLLSSHELFIWQRILPVQDEIPQATPAARRKPEHNDGMLAQDGQCCARNQHTWNPNDMLERTQEDGPAG